jgi:hypothetical protein
MSGNNGSTPQQKDEISEQVQGVYSLARQDHYPSWKSKAAKERSFAEGPRIRPCFLIDTDQPHQAMPRLEEGVFEALRSVLLAYVRRNDGASRDIL